MLHRIDPGFAYPAVRYAEALALRRPLAQAWVDQCLAGCDLVHLPTLVVTPPTIAATTEGQPEVVMQAIAHVTHATRGINYLGLPALSVPAGFSRAGLPLAFQLVARPYAEARLLQAADAYQRDTDWHRRLPPAPTERHSPNGAT